MEKNDAAGKLFGRISDASTKVFHKPGPAEIRGSIFKSD